MYKKILIGYDGSSFSDVALRQGAELARLCNAEILLVGVVATTAYMALAEGTGGVDIWGMERKELEEALKCAEQDLSSNGLSVTAIIREGGPATEIVNCAAESRADLVVLGHSDKGIFARWMEGSVGEGLLRDLPCNLLIATG